MIEYLRGTGEGLPVLVDTSVWIASTRRPQSAVADELRLLLERDEVATTEVIIAEVLQGAKTEDDFRRWSDTLDALHFFSGDVEVWRKAAHVSFDLRTHGMITPLADLLVATVALENDLSVYAIDDHFSRVPGLRLHSPRNYSVRNQDQDLEPGQQDE